MLIPQKQKWINQISDKYAENEVITFYLFTPTDALYDALFL